eukprot:jgi/Hompol1/1011/HPOL_004494-RA
MTIILIAYGRGFWGAGIFIPGGTLGASVDVELLQEVVNGIFMKSSVNRFGGDAAGQLFELPQQADDVSRQMDVEEPDIQDVGNYFCVVNAFDVPRCQFVKDRGSFARAKQHGAIIATADARTALFRDRFELIYQRLLRNEAFRPPAFATNDDSYFKITPILHLKGRKPGRYLLFGMLTSIQDGNYHLEDLDAFIQLEFQKKMQQGAGMFTRNSFVLVQGEYTEYAKFRVDVIGHPLPERREDSLYSVVKRIELNAVDVSIVFISDVWLDQTRVLQKLRVLFDGLTNAIIPLAFVLCGNFSSTPYVFNGNEGKRYKEGFDNLADLVSEFPQIAQTSHFVFVPGPHDPWAPSVLPRVPIPDSLTTKLRQKIKHTHFTTSPTRLKYCTLEMVVFRDEISSAMRRHSILPIATEEDLPEDERTSDIKHLVSTLLDQSHLAPLPLEIKPRYWEHDHALRLYPQPHLLVLAENADPYHDVEYEGCLCINPGSFPNNGYQFMLYSPALH